MLIYLFETNIFRFGFCWVVEFFKSFISLFHFLFKKNWRCYFVKFQLSTEDKNVGLCLYILRGNNPMQCFRKFKFAGWVERFWNSRSDDDVIPEKFFKSRNFHWQHSDSAQKQNSQGRCKLESQISLSRRTIYVTDGFFEWGH